jgi:primosomal protein N' (replication factor Y)
VTLVAVAVPVPALGLLTYRVPDSFRTPVPGARVVVPLGHRSLTGVVIGEAQPPGGDVELRDLLDVLDAEPFLPADVVQLTDWVAEYYLAGPGAALSAAMPPHALTSRVDAFRTARVVSLSADGQAIAERLAVEPRCAPGEPAIAMGTRQKEALLLLRSLTGAVPTAALAGRGVSAAVVKRLEGMGLVQVQQQRVERDPFSSAGLPPPPDWSDRTLTEEQASALQQLQGLVDAGGFRVALLHGVTGSGKTEVYLRLADAVLRAGAGVLMLVPEIALTPAAASLFRARFGTRVAIQHSGLSDGERHDQWHRIRRGEVSLVIGTRSAIFAPLARPGLIIIDEEHDTSYKQEETPRYHGRDVAIMRGKFAGALVLLGSATPSLESSFNAEQGKYTLVTLPHRVLDRPLAMVRVVNMREEFAAEGPDVILSAPLRDGIRQRLDRREQTLVLLNRRGYAASVFCRQCGGTIECPQCSVSLTVHTSRRDWRAQCHYCNFSRTVPKQCPTCAAPYLEHIGFGTERVEAEITALYPEARLGRIDRDTVRRRGTLTALLGRFARQELDILVGTQMIAKGHDFPHVTLVGVISADVGLGLADFRAAERTFQLLTQVAGRAGRGEQPGEAIVQTLFPSHYSIQLATSQDYTSFYTKEITFRQAMRYPPAIAMVNVVTRGKTHDQAMEGAARLLRRTMESPGARGRFAVLGPAPAPLRRLRGDYRAQFFLKGTSRASMRAALKDALAALPDLARKTSVDVDPLNML